MLKYSFVPSPFILLVSLVIVGTLQVHNCFSQKTKKPKNMYAYLALGDSYTIGDGVSLNENFPYQAVQILHKRKLNFAEPVIIAKTGWTTNELATAIKEHNITDTFSVVTLLIGVNNQYRNRSIENYQLEFEQLLQQAIAFAGGKTNHVFVLSIPDWGVTPFAHGRDKHKIATEIDAYNAAQKELAIQHKCHFIAITESTRQNGQNQEYIVEDGLHPSAKEYTIWAEKLADEIAKEFK